MIALNIETATTVCSVCVTNEHEILSCRETADANSHSEVLTIQIQEVIEEANLSFDDLDVIAFSEGPGSYTGLRIGASVAKGLCYSLKIPMIAISTLKSMAANYIKKKPNTDDNILLCPMIDARRMEVYTALYDNRLIEILEPCAKIIAQESFNDYLISKRIVFFGNGAGKCESILKHHNSLFDIELYTSAKSLANLTSLAFENQDFVDPTYFEPKYIKNFHRK